MQFAESKKKISKSLDFCIEIMSQPKRHSNFYYTTIRREMQIFSAFDFLRKNVKFSCVFVCGMV